MIALVMVVGHEFRDGLSKVPLAHRNDPIEALLFDRPHEPLRIGIRIGRLQWCLHHAKPRALEELAHRCGPFPIAVAEQHAMGAQRPIIDCHQGSTDLPHEALVGMWRRPDDLDPA